MAKRWMVGLEERVARDYDDQTIFERFCRQPGTRINWIMTRIEQGWSDEDIADKTGTLPAVIGVYRKALNGTLCSIDNGFGPVGDTYDKITNTYILVGTMKYMRGMSGRAIAEALGITQSRVHTCLERYRRMALRNGEGNQ